MATRWARRSAVWLLASGLFLSCEGQRQASRSSAAREYTDRICRLAGDDPVVAAAVYGFVGQAQPRAGRFVYIPGSDTSLPPAGVQALQDRGPTYLYSTDPAQQAVVERQLDAIGDYPTLLVAYHGLTKPDALRPVVKLSGHYVSGTAVRGKSIGIRAISPQCDSTGNWVVPSTAGEAGAG